MEPQPRSILVPLDGSPGAEHALPYAVALAEQLTANLLLVQVLAPPESRLAWPTTTFIPATLEQLVQDEQRAASAYLHGVARRCPAQISVQTDVLLGIDVACTIVEYAERHPAIAAIVMATHGQTGLRHLLLGSVAEEVLKRAAVPLLLTHAPQGRTTPVSYRKLIVPLDGSRFAEQALIHATALCATPDTELVLVGVGSPVDDLGLVDGGIEPLWMLSDGNAIDQQLSAYLDAHAAHLNDRGIRARVIFARGTPADQILHCSAVEHADLIVMATHGRTGLQRRWLGSTAYDLLQTAFCPMLLVHPIELPAEMDSAPAERQSVAH